MKPARLTHVSTIDRGYLATVYGRIRRQEVPYLRGLTCGTVHNFLAGSRTGTRIRRVMRPTGYGCDDPSFEFGHDRGS
jgi:hypothetical protein